MKPSRVRVIGHPSRILRARNNLRITGRFESVELIDAKTGLIKRRLGPFPNIIVNTALNAIGAGNTLDSLVEYLAVGTNNATPTAGDTSLISQIGSRYNDNGGFSETQASGPAYAYWEFTKTRVIPEGDCNGNLTELGMFSAASGGTMWCRQLFLDGGGSPTTVTKTSDEKLRVVYSWRVYLVTSPTTDTITIDGVPTACDSRAIQGDSADAWGFDGYGHALGVFSTDFRRALAWETNSFPTIDGGRFSGTNAQSSSISNVSYVGGSYQRDQDIVFEPGVANFVTGIGAIALPYPGGYLDGSQGLGTTFDPKVGKDNTERFTVRVRTSWGRH